MVRVQEYYETKDKALLALDWYYRNYPSSVLSVYETSPKEVRIRQNKELNTTLEKVWCLYGTQYGND